MGTGADDVQGMCVIDFGSYTNPNTNAHRAQVVCVHSTNTTIGRHSGVIKLVVQEIAQQDRNMAIRKIISRSIGVDVIAAEDLANNSVTTAEITDGAVTQAKLASSVELGVGAFLGDN